VAEGRVIVEQRNQFASADTRRHIDVVLAGDCSQLRD
jgi:hypothetical protein